MTPRAMVVVTAFLLAVAAVPAAAQPTPVGPSFEVGSYTGVIARKPRVAMDPNGNFVVVWSSNAFNSGGSDVFARLFDVSGTALGDQFVVNTLMTGSHSYPGVAVMPSGDFVVVWNGYASPNSLGVQARIFDAAGSPLTGELQINTYTEFQSSAADVAVDGSGNFVVVWQNRHLNGDRLRVLGRAFDPNGAPLGSDFQVNTSTLTNQYQSKIGMNSSGNFVVAWTSAGQYSGATVRAQRFTAAAARVGGEFVVNDPNNPQSQLPDVAMHDNGAFVVAWTDLQSFNGLEVLARRYDSMGGVAGGQFVVNSYTTFIQQSPAISKDPSGGFVITWQGAVPTKSLDGIAARAYNGLGSPIGAQFTVGDIANPSIDSAVAIDPNGHMVVVWQRDPTATGVFARLYTGAGVCVAGDPDADGICDDFDSCPSLYNPAQTDLDGDNVGDACDNCGAVANSNQAESDGDLLGDACDNCAFLYNPGQADADIDGAGDGCDVCQGIVDPGQQDVDADGRGNACDNCVTVYNPGQQNSDALPEGDACDLTVTFPLVMGDVNCAGLPPTITWTPETYTGFKVFLGADATFNVKITSGKKLLKVPQFLVPATKWTKFCGKIGTDLFLKVQGKSSRPTVTEFSETVVIAVP